MTPHLVGLAKRLESMPFHIVATHCQRNPKEEVVAYLKSQGLSPDTPNFTLTSFGGHPDVKGNGYVPYYMVFDHRGKLVQHHMCGDYHGGDGLAMIEWVDKLLLDAPAIYLGEEPFVEIPDLAKKVGAKANLAKSVKAISKRLDGGAEGAEKAELERLLAVIVGYRDTLLERASGLVGSRPSRVVPMLEDLEKELKGTDLAAAVSERIDEIEGADEFETALDVEKSLAKIRAQIERLKSCRTCKRGGSRVIRMDCTECRTMNRAALGSAAKKLTKLLAESGSLPIAAEVKALLEEVR